MKKSIVKTEKIVIRVGEKNNFNMTNREHKELEKYTGKGDIFVNSNAFTKIDSTYPSIVTINPYMKFVPLRGDLSNVKAVRLKIFKSSKIEYRKEFVKCIAFCLENDLKILLTYMRYKSIKTAEKYTGPRFRDMGYIHDHGYFRPIESTRKWLYEYVSEMIIMDDKDPKKWLYECDSKGKGCPSCGNCHKLTYGYKTATIKALNLSISGVKDSKGRRGLCPYHCPDCFAKLVCFGKRPQCDKLISNKKMQGKIDHK